MNCFQIAHSLYTSFALSNSGKVYSFGGILLFCVDSRWVETIFSGAPYSGTGDDSFSRTTATLLRTVSAFSIVAISAMPEYFTTAMGTTLMLESGGRALGFGIGM